jgi:hypothetical protein
MTLLDAITRISYSLRGTDDEVPTEGDEEFVYWLETLNRKKDDLYTDIKQRWASSFKVSSPNEPGTVATSGTTTLTGTGTFFTDYRAGDKITVSGETERTIDTITSNTVLTVTVAFSNTASGKTFTHSTIIADGDEEYSLHRSFLHPSDRCYVTKTDGSKVFFNTTPPQARDDLTQEVYISGINPKTLTFSSDIDTGDQLIGGTLTIPGYYLPADVSDGADLLPVPDPNWLCMATAAEIAINDVIYEDKTVDLNEKANFLYRQMAMTNRSQVYGQSRKIPYNVKRIKAPRFTG